MHVLCHLSLFTLARNILGGESTELNCGASGLDVSNYTWYIQKPGTSSEPVFSSCDNCPEYEASGTGSLNINGVRARNEGVYQCMYTESSKRMSGSSINVTVLGMILM